MSSQTIFVPPGATNRHLYVGPILQDAGATNPGDPLTGLAYNTSGLTCYYKKNATDAATTLTLATQTATGAHSDGGFVELDSTNMPGVYRLDISDTMLTGSSPNNIIVLNGAADMATHVIHVVLTTPADVRDWDGANVATVNTSGVPIVDTGYVGGTAQSAGDIYGQIGTNGASLSSIPWNSAWDAEVQSEVNDGLVALHLDRIFAADYDPASPPGVATALFNELMESDGGVARFTANALEQAAATSVTVGSIATDAITAASLNADAVTEIWGSVVESNGSRTAQQVLSILLAALAGVTSSSGSVFSDPSGTNTRISATVNGSNERTAITLTPSS